VRLRTVTSLREFDDLAKVWREVVESGGHSSPLASHDWFACCWRTAGPNRARELWLIEDAAGPVALIPLVRSRGRYRGLPARIVEFMHAPESLSADVPIARDVDDVMETILDRLELLNDWDVFLIPGLRSHSPTWKAFESASGTRFSWRVAERVSVPYLTFTGREPSVPAALASLRRAAAPSLAQAGAALEINEFCHLDPRGPIFHEIMSVVRAQPPGLATSAPPTAEEVRRFFRELTSRASVRRWLSVWVLRLDGRIVETEYQLASQGVVHALRRDADQSPAGLQLRDVLTLNILETLAARPAVRTYYRMPLGRDDGPGSSFDTEERLCIELLARHSYQRLYQGLESRVTALARRLWGERKRPCA